MNLDVVLILIRGILFLRVTSFAGLSFINTSALFTRMLVNRAKTSYDLNSSSDAILSVHPWQSPLSFSHDVLFFLLVEKKLSPNVVYIGKRWF